MFLFLSFFYLTLLFHLNIAENCNRFCEVNLRDGYYNIITENNVILVNPQYCTHLIVNANWKNSEVNYAALEKAYAHLQDSEIPSKIKILFSLRNNLKQLVKANYSFDEQVLKAFKKFDGCYIDWQDSVFLLDYRLNVNTYIKNLRNIAKNKIIAVTIGAENIINGRINYQIFNENVDFVALEFFQRLMDIHTQNYMPSRQLELREPREKIEVRYLANKWIKNGFSRSKLLVFTKVTDHMQEPRMKTIWSSLNNFGGVLLHGIQNFKHPQQKYNEMIDNANKFERVQVCDSDTTEKAAELTFFCYISMKTDVTIKFTEKYQKCDRIILQKAYVDSNYSITVPEKSFEKIVGNFQSFDRNATSLILSIYINNSLTLNNTDNIKQFAASIIDFVYLHKLDGIELIVDDAINLKHVIEIVTAVNGMTNIQIGLQVNVFKIPETFVKTINEATWVTHKINSLSDASLAIYYQWLPDMLNMTEEKENPEDDLILNRKYLCLNETLKTNLPSADELLNLPMIFTIREDLEERKKALEPYSNEKWFIVNFFFMGQKYTTDLYYLRYEKKETIEYKIKIALKHGFGGMALDSINNDDIDGLCGNSVFNLITNTFKNST